MSDVRTYRVRDSAEFLEFDGTKLADVSTMSDLSPRWTQMELYKTTDGQYVLHIIGASVVYHRHHGPCNSGVETVAADLPDDAEPCFKCNPPELDKLSDADLVDFEEDRYASHICPDATAVISQLRNPRSSGGRSSGSISGLGQRLLANAARVDDGIANATTTVRRI